VIHECLPSQPVRIIGFRSLPKAGEPITCVESEAVAEELIDRRKASGGADAPERAKAESPKSIEVTGVSAQLQKLPRIYEKYNIDMEAVSDVIRIPVLLKADADGTLCALHDSVVEIGKQSSLNVIIDPIAQSVGPLTESEVEVAKESNALILSFNLNHTNKEALALIDSLGVVMKSSNVIYSLLDEAKVVFASYLPPIYTYNVHGKAVVKAVFQLTVAKQTEIAAGLRVLSGTIFKSKTVISGITTPCYYRVYRNGKIISPAGANLTVSSLKIVKDSVEQVRFGEECGLVLKDFKDFCEGDEVECYTVEEKQEFI
jgi:translation initiation factor IF-2